MKNTKTGKLLTRILTALVCVLVVAMMVCFFFPYFTIAEEYHFVLNTNPVDRNYSLVDLMWIQTKTISEHFAGVYGNFNINNYVTTMALSFIFGLGMIISSVWHTANEVRRYPDMASGVVSNIAAVGWGVFSLLAYPQNQLLDLGNPAYMGIRNVIIILSIAGAVVAVVRFVVWLLTEIQIAKDRKARLALL